MRMRAGAGAQLGGPANDRARAVKKARTLARTKDDCGGSVPVCALARSFARPLAGRQSSVVIGHIVSASDPMSRTDLSMARAHLR